MDLLRVHLLANLVFAVLLIGYAVALRSVPLPGLRRAYLLLAPVVAIALPCLPPTPLTSTLGPVTLPLFSVSSASTTAADPAWTWTALHAAISALLLARLVWRIAVAHRKVREGGDAALSFLGRMHVPAHVSGDLRTAMVQHERAHVRLGHSYDLIGLELLAALWWSNPFCWLALRELRLVHELQADRAAAHAIPDYDRLLLAHAMGTAPRHLFHPFDHRHLKNRLIMLNTPFSLRPLALRTLPALVLTLAGALWLAATPLPDTGPDAVVLPGADRAAEYPGGMEALAAYLGKAITYPAAARAEGVQGTVYVGFTVQPDGRVTDAAVKRGVRNDIDQEALRVVGSMPAWTPAAKDGKPVASQMTLPIAFKLGDH